MYVTHVALFGFVFSSSVRNSSTEKQHSSFSRYSTAKQTDRVCFVVARCVKLLAACDILRILNNPHAWTEPHYGQLRRRPQFSSRRLRATVPPLKPTRCRCTAAPSCCVLHGQLQFKSVGRFFRNIYPIRKEIFKFSRKLFRLH